jgi:tetracycline resistance efflux pump
MLAFTGHSTFPANIVTGLYTILMKNESTDGTYFNGLMWVLFVCGLFGPFIELLRHSGSIKAVGDFFATKIKSKKQAYLLIYFYNIIYFIDDYLCALAAGSTLNDIASKHKINKAELGYIIGAVCVPMMVVFPVSTWTVFIGGLMKSAGVGTADQSNIEIFLSVIPFSIYGIVAMILALFYVLFQSPKVSTLTDFDDTLHTLSNTEETKEYTKSSIFNFILPIMILLGATFYFNYDILYGVLIALSLTMVWYCLTQTISIAQCVEIFEDGFHTISFILILLVSTYLLKYIGDEMHLTTYLIGIIEKSVSISFLPLMIFLVIGLISLATGSSWGIYAVVMPIIVALCHQTGAPIYLNIGALVSAGIWGANACLYSDSRILIASSTSTNMTEQSAAQFPYTLIVAGVTAIIYLILGFLV